MKIWGCFTATQLPKKAVLVSYDKDFKKVREVKLQTPDEMLRNPQDYS